MKKSFLILLPLLIGILGCSSAGEKNEAAAAPQAARAASAPAQESPASIENLELKTIEITTPKDGIIRERYTCTYGNTVRSFIVCKAAQSSPKALVLMLHGYAGSGESFMNDISFDEKATKKDFVLIFVDGISDPDDKTSAPGWNSGIKDSPKDDLGFLKSLMEIFQKKFGISKSTVHMDVATRLRQLDPALYTDVRAVLDVNKAERHIRGGNATREKYRLSTGQARRA